MILVDRNDYTWKLENSLLKEDNFKGEFKVPRINIDEYLIRHISLAITNNCNLACEYCYKSIKSDGCNYEIPYYAIEKFIEKLTSININGNKVLTIQLIGGEPTFHKDFIKICTLIIKKGLAIRVSTNGTNTKVLQSTELEHLYKSGDIEFRISMDEYPENDIKTVRKGTTKIVSNNIKYLINHGANVSVKSVITKSNIDDIPKILEYLASLGVKNFSYSSLYNLGAADYNKFYEKNYIPDLEIYKKFLKVVQDYPNYATMLKSNIIFHMLTSIFVKKSPYYFSKFYLFINYDGKIYCQDQLTYKKYNIGNIYDTQADIVPIIQRLKEKKIKHELLKKKCLKCDFYPFCVKGNYGELYNADHTLQADFPTCKDMMSLLEYIINNNTESKKFLMSILGY